MATEKRVISSDRSTVYSLESRGSLELDLHALMNDGNLSIFKEVEELGLLFVRIQRRKAFIFAGGYIGLIPLTPNVTIEVTPKLPVRNLAHVLQMSRLSLDSLASANRLYLVQDESSDSVLEFLACNLLDAMREVELRGLHKEYRCYSKATSHPAGKFDISASLQKYWTRGQNHIVSAKRFQQSSDIAPNRLIRAALVFILQRLKPRSESGSIVVQRANRSLLSFPNSIGALSNTDLQACKNLGSRLN